MSKTWRPENWEKTINGILLNDKPDNVREYGELFADAMLEALRKKKETRFLIDREYQFPLHTKFGQLVFIPDDPPAGTVTESGYFCPQCWKQVKNGYLCGCESQWVRTLTFGTKSVYRICPKCGQVYLSDTLHWCSIGGRGVI